MVDRIADFTQDLPSRRVSPIGQSSEAGRIADEFLAAPPEQGAALSMLMERVDRAADLAVESGSAGMLAAIPGGGLYSSALAEFYSRALNRFGGFASSAPGLTAMEDGVLRWIAQDVCGMPVGSAGVLTTGGSSANLSAVLAARRSRLGENIERGCVYVTAQAHHSVAKAARIAGIRNANIRVVPHTGDLRMDVPAAEAAVQQDRRAGLHPFLLVGTAGTTNTGAIDPLRQVGELARREELWFHVDAAYGGFFRLTRRGRGLMSGIESADSITLDPHKSLFLPFGTGALVVRDPARLAAAYADPDDLGVDGRPYLQDVRPYWRLPDYSGLSPELSREVRGLRLWLPLHLHGVAAFREALDEKLDLAARLHERLCDLPGLEVSAPPTLSIVTFRVRPADASETAQAAADKATRALLDRINADGRVLIHSTTIEGRQAIRICILTHRTHADLVERAVEIMTAAL